MKTIFLEFSITCASCGRPLPVNSAAENTLCRHCNSYTETPVELWQVLVTPRLLDATGMKPDSDSRAAGIMAGVGSYRMTLGQRAPRCRICEGAWNVEDLMTIGNDDASAFTCRECGTVRSLRRPPPWFEKVCPFVRLLVDETAPEDDAESPKGDTSISIFCYHCGSPLPLDGSSRTVQCKYCNGEFLIPDDVWSRLNPVSVAHPWYVIVDLGDAEAMLPYEIDKFIDLAGLPDDDTALLWEEESEFRMGRVSGNGLLTWVARDIPCS